MAKLLLAQAGVNVNLKSRGGDTPLSRAVWIEYVETVELLLTQDDIDPDSKDVHGKTPLSLATAGGHSA